MSDMILNAKSGITEKERKYNESIFLNKHLTFDPFLIIKGKDDVIEDILEIILDHKKSIDDKAIYRIDQKRNCLNIICANLLDLMNSIQKNENIPKCIEISMNNNYWKENKFNKTTKFIPECIHLLEYTGFLNFKKGQKGLWISKISLTRKFIDYFGYNKKIKLYYKIPEIIMRDDPIKTNKKRQTGAQMNFKETIFSKKIKSDIKKINLVNEKAKVLIYMPFYDVVYLRTDIHAVFNKHWGHGRMYSGTATGFQSCSSDYRHTITINDQKTVELDFSGMLPNLLYADVGIQYEGDPYAFFGSDVIGMRKIFKNIFLYIINNPNEAAAIKTINYMFYKKPDLKELMEHNNLDLKKDVLPRFYEMHSAIKEHFFEKSGYDSTRVDSTIAIEIMNSFVKDEIPILGIHDSFIVEEKYEERLRYTMNEIYRIVTGFKCEIK